MDSSILKAAGPKSRSMGRKKAREKGEVTEKDAMRAKRLGKKRPGVDLKGKMVGRGHGGKRTR